jgi:hypothetical protein
MLIELTNLLPTERIRVFRREYFFRLGTIGAIVVAILIAVHGTLLVPTYLYLHDLVLIERTHLAEITENLASSGEGEIKARRTHLRESADQLLALASAPSASAVIRAILLVPHTGIVITSFAFHKPSPDGRLTITGTASTREALRQYQLALSSLSFAKSADLPLSAYAKESDIPFTITLTGPLTP